MAKQQMCLVGLCAVLAACGGSSDNGSDEEIKIDSKTMSSDELKSSFNLIVA